MKKNSISQKNHTDKTPLQRPNLYDYLKVLAVLTMIVDHVGYYLFPTVLELRLIGRLAFPIFLFLVGFSWSYRRRRDIFLYGILIWSISFWFTSFYENPQYELNILLGISWARALLHWIEKTPNKYLPYILCILLATIHPWLVERIDYGSLPFFFTLWWRLAREKSQYFWYGSIFLVRLFIQNIQIFDFWFKSWNYKSISLLFLAYGTLLLLFATLKKANTPLIGNHYQNEIILFISKNALLIYALHIALFLLILVLSPFRMH